MHNARIIILAQFSYKYFVNTKLANKKFHSPLEQIDILL